MKLLLFLVLFWVQSALSDVYRWRDASGSDHFSDRRHAGAERLEIRPGYGYSKVKAVYDGDTLVLDDGRKVRLSGINTPEIRHKSQMAEAGGEEAKEWLKSRLLGARVRLQLDRETTDHYGRWLAHVFTPDDRHINLELVVAGLASVNIYPPNLLYADALIRAQNLAEKTGAGIWRYPQYAVLPVELVSDHGHSGWTRVRGKIIDIRRSRKYVYLKFSNRFQARIARRSLSLFPEPADYLGKTVEIRGWINKSPNGFVMLIRHPSAILVSPS